ncbi:hypothetical protein PV325_002838, partial [Microctonus aethiopoides]
PPKVRNPWLYGTVVQVGSWLLGEGVRECERIRGVESSLALRRSERTPRWGVSCGVCSSSLLSSLHRQRSHTGVELTSLSSFSSPSSSSSSSVVCAVFHCDDITVII